MQIAFDNDFKQVKFLSSAAVFTYLFLSSVLMLPAISHADPKNTYFEIGGGFSTGDFGGQTRTNLYYINSVIGYVTQSYDLSITVPYPFMISDNNDSHQNGMMNTKNGIGDITLQAGGLLLEENMAGFSIYGSLSAKLPTADEKDGLGTGEADYGAFLDIGKNISNFKISLLPGYIYTGDSATQKYGDINIYGIGASAIFDQTYYYLSYEWRKSMFSDTEDPQFINGGFSHAFNTTYAIKSDVSFGLNKGAPDLGLKIGLVTWF